MQRVDSVRTPQVVGGLLDVDCDKTMIRGLLTSVTDNFPIDKFVHEVEQIVLVQCICYRGVVIVAQPK